MTPQTANRMETERSVLIAYKRDDDSEWRCSGVRINGPYVLTVDHCASGFDHQIVVNGRSYAARVVVRGTPQVDLAILEVNGIEQVDALQCALIDRTKIDTIRNCVAVGFPRWKLRDSRPIRAQISATVATSEGTDPAAASSEGLLSLKITDPIASDISLAPGQLDRPGSLWAGMSGAAVTTSEGQLIGIIRSHVSHEGPRYLTASPLSFIDQLPETTARAFWAALGVAYPTKLPTLPLPPSHLGMPITRIVIGQIPRAPLSYVARDVSARLDLALDGTRNQTIAALVGMRGVGKTQIAACYARDSLAKNTPLVVWIDASTEDALLDGIDHVVERLSLYEIGRDESKSICLLREFLETSDLDSLFIFDGAPNPDVIRSVLPGGGRARFLITTTDRRFDGMANLIEVPEFTRSESINFLTNRTSLAEYSGADGVADALGDLPVALAQAASVIRRRHWTFDAYLDRLRNTSIASLLTRLPGDDYPAAVAAALQLSIDNIATDGSHLTALLIPLLAAIAGDTRVDFALRLAHVALGNGQHSVDEVEKAIGELIDVSIISSSLTGDTIRMHSLMARIVREECILSGEWDAILRVIEAMIAEALFPISESWRRRREGGHLVQIVEGVWSTASAHAPQPLLRSMTSHRLWVIEFMVAVSEISRAIDLSILVVHDTERIFGADDELCLAARHLLALSLHNHGEHERAATVLESLVEDSTRILGISHPKTLERCNQLGSAYRFCGRLSYAVDVFQDLATTASTALGPRHFTTLSARNDLADALTALGRVQGAISVFEDLIPDVVDVLGDDSPDTLAVRSNLARAYEVDGQVDRSIGLFEHVLADSERILGADHPRTSASRSNLAHAIEARGDTTRAIELFKQAASELTELVGVDHPHALAVRDNLARAYHSDGQLAEAITLFTAVLADRSSALGPSHPDTLITQHKLAVARLASGDVRAAIQELETVILHRVRVLGSANPRTLSSRRQLALAYQSDGRYKEALDELLSALADSVRELGEDHALSIKLRRDVNRVKPSGHA